MGTGLGIITAGAPRQKVEPLWKSLCEEAQRLDRMLNRFDPDSEVSSLNAAAGADPKPASASLAEMIRSAEGYKARTGGLFDITLGGTTLDFGGFAKGWFLRTCAEALEREGVHNAFVNFGGSTILALGAQPGGDCWKVGVRDPFDGKTVAEVELRDETLSTSGNSPSYDGHILNPLTGERVRGRRLATAVCADCLDAEVLSTALMAAAPEQIQQLRREFPRARIEIYDNSE